MPAHLRSLRRCDDCGKPGTQTLHNSANAPIGVYCDRHAAPALKAWQKKHEDER